MRAIGGRASAHGVPCKPFPDHPVRGQGWHNHRDLQRTPSGNSSDSVGVFASFDVLQQLPRLINNGETTNGTKRSNAMREYRPV
jgi:hypothetical protein